MELSGRDGLGVSVAIYMGAILGTLGVIAVPVYYAIAPQVYDNPPPRPLDPLLNGPIVGNRVSGPAPLALLKHPAIVDPAVVAALNAKTAQRTEPVRRQAAHQPARRERAAAVAQLPERPERSGFFLFNLFGG